MSGRLNGHFFCFLLLIGERTRVRGESLLNFSPCYRLFLLTDDNSIECHFGGLCRFKNPRINVMAFQALECPIFKTFIGGCRAH